MENPVQAQGTEGSEARTVGDDHHGHVTPVMLVCKGSVGDVWPAVQLMLAYRAYCGGAGVSGNHDDRSKNKVAAAASLWQLVVLCHPDVMRQVQALAGTHDNVTWLPYQQSVVDVSRLRDDQDGRQHVLEVEFSHCLSACQRLRPRLIAFNLFSLEAWLIAKHLGVCSLAVSPFLPTKTMPPDVARAVEEEHPGFLAALRDAPQGCVGYRDVRTWLWRSMLSDFGTCCELYSLDSCPLVSALNTSPSPPPSPPSSTCQSRELTAAADVCVSDDVHRTSVAEPLPKRRALPCATTHGYVKDTPLILIITPGLIPREFIVSSSMYVVDWMALQSLLPWTTIGDRSRAASSELPEKVTEFLQRCRSAPVYCGFGAMDELNVMTVEEWKKFLSILLRVLCSRKLPLLVQTKPGSNLHTALCQLKLHLMTSSEGHVTSSRRSSPEPSTTPLKLSTASAAGGRCARARSPAGDGDVAAVDVSTYVRRDVCTVLAPLRHAALFPDCCAVVHHAGVGTVQTAMAARTPQILFPLLFDQTSNAEHAQRLGLGVLAFAHPTQLQGCAVLDEIFNKLTSLSCSLDDPAARRPAPMLSSRYSANVLSMSQLHDVIVQL